MKKIIGKCKQCGACCKNTRLDFGIPIEHPYDFLRNDFNDFIERFIGAHIRLNPHFDFTKANRIEIYTIGDRIRGHISGIQCKALVKKGKKYICTIHDRDKPDVCVRHPSVNHILCKGCGYKIINVKDKK